MRYLNESSQKYYVAARKATAEGFVPGSSHWWSALKFHKEFPNDFERDNRMQIEIFELLSHVAH